MASVQSYSYREKEPTGDHWMLFTNRDGRSAPLPVDLETYLKYKALYGYPSVRWTDVTPPGVDANDARAPVQAEFDPATRRWLYGPGTVAWAEHEQAWTAYHATYHGDQSAERIAERGGFGYSELIRFLGHEPTTWRPL